MKKKVGILIGMLSVLAIISNSFGMWGRVGSGVARGGSRLTRLLKRQGLPGQRQASRVGRRYYSEQKPVSVKGKGLKGLAYSAGGSRQFLSRINPMNSNFFSNTKVVMTVNRWLTAVGAGLLSWIGFDMLQEELNLPHILVRPLSKAEKATMDSWLKKDHYRNLFHDIKGDKAKIQYVAEQLIDNDFAIENNTFSEKIIGKIFEVASPAVRHDFVEGMYDALLAGKKVSPMFFSVLDKKRSWDFVDSFIDQPGRFSVLVTNNDLIDTVLWRIYYQNSRGYDTEKITRLILSVQDDQFIHNTVDHYNGKKMLLGLVSNLKDSWLRDQLEQKIVQSLKGKLKYKSFLDEILGY